METSYKIMLGLHITSGFLALLCGFISLISKKGGKTHRLSGKLFFFSMLGVCLTSVYISVIKNNQFLLVIGIFSFYLSYNGYRAIKDKSLKPNTGDWIVIGVTSINSFFMLYSMNIILMVFGILCFYILVQNIRTNIMVLQNKVLPDKMWLKRHIGMMMGAFISTLTAFLVVNAKAFSSLNLPPWFMWLLPTFALLPLSIYYTNKYVKQPVLKAKD